MRREIDRFICQDDDGNHYTVIASLDMIDDQSSDDPEGTVPGKIEFRLSTDERLTRLDGATFEILAKDIKKIIRKI